MTNLFTYLSNWKLKYICACVVLLCLGIEKLWGASETFNFASGAATGSGTSRIITWSGTSCTVVQAKGGGATDVNASYTGTNLRWYASHDITFTPKAGMTITSIVLTGSEADYNGQTMTERTSTSASISASSNATTVTGSWTTASPLTLRMGKQFRIGSVVITYSTGGSSDYVLVESAGDIGAGEYLIVYNNTYALKTHYGNQDANTYATYQDISTYYSNKVIESNATTDSYAHTVVKTTNGYSIYSNYDDSYLGCSSNNNTGLRWDTQFAASTDEWTLGVGTIQSVAQTGRYIKWNNTSNQYRFATYTSGSCENIQLFKKASSSCGAPSAPTNGSFSLNHLLRTYRLPAVYLKGTYPAPPYIYYVYIP